ncbi:two-component system response regulator NreC [Pedobacter sp. UYEF25]
MNSEINLLHVSLIPDERNLSVKNLHGVDNINVVGSLSSKLDAVNFLEEHPLPHLLFLETPSLGSLELNFVKILKNRHPSLKILSSGFSEDLDLLQTAYEHKIDGFAMSRPPAEELSYAVKQIVSGQLYLCCQLATKCLHKLATSKGKLVNGIVKPSLKITNRELEILKFVAQGFTNTEISERLFSSKRTIEGNRKKLLQKTGTKNTAELIGFAVRNNFIE